MPNGESGYIKQYQSNVIREFAERYLAFNVKMLLKKHVKDNALLSALQNQVDTDSDIRMPTEREIEDIMIDVLIEGLRGVL